MKKLVISKIVKSLIFIGLFTLSINASAQATIVNPTTTNEEGGFANHDNNLTIMVLNINTNEVQRFESMPLSAVINQLSTGEYQITLYTNNHKTQFIYIKP